MRSRLNSTSFRSVLSLAVALGLSGGRYGSAREPDSNSASPLRARHHLGRRPTPKRRPTPAALPIMARVPAFSYLDQDGHPLTNEDLLDHVWVADFIYTRCTTACPILSARMVMVQRKVIDARARFVSFSVDPEHDTPAALKRYAAQWTTDESRWRLLRTSKKTIGALAVEMLAVAEPSGDPAEPFNHSNTFLLVDQAGFVRGEYRSDDQSDVDRLIAEMQLLLGASEEKTKPSAATAEGGQQLFVAFGCPGCHAQEKIAGSLAGIFDSTVTLEDGTRVKADEAYLRESILAPGEKVVRGYPVTMPSYAGQLSEAELGLLVDYLKSLRKTPAPAPERRRAVDPVCKMEISAGPGTERAVYEGRTYYFCSEPCRARFTREPRRYARP